MTMEERIRAGAERLFGGCNFNALFDSEADRYLRDARAVLVGAIPELFDGSAMLVSTKPTPIPAGGAHFVTLATPPSS